MVAWFPDSICFAGDWIVICTRGVLCCVGFYIMSKVSKEAMRWICLGHLYKPDECRCMWPPYCESFSAQR